MLENHNFSALIVAPPLFYIIVAEKNRLNNLSRIGSMVQTAVSFWNGEPRWFLNLKTFLCPPSICHPEGNESASAEGGGAGAETQGSGAEGGHAKGGGAEGGGAEGRGAEGGSADAEEGDDGAEFDVSFERTNAYKNSTIPYCHRLLNQLIQEEEEVRRREEGEE